MQKRLFNTFSSIFVLGSLLLPIFITQPALALIDSSSQTAACSGIDVGTGNACTADGTSGLDGIVKNVIDILSIIVGVASVIMIIIGGFRYVVSGGDSNSTSSAKNTIVYALVGLVVAVLAQILVQFVLYKTG